MRRLSGLALSAGLVLSAGCATGPLLDNPARVEPAGVGCDNPMRVTPDLPGAAAYAALFERTLDVLDDYFEIAYENRYDGRILTHPRTAPGFGQPWKLGSPDPRERVLATLQSMRYRAEVLIQPVEEGGYLVFVAVHKELEDLPQPVRLTAGAAAFRSDSTVERQYEVVDPLVVSKVWIPVGRDPLIEQAILKRIKECF
jgi:hypothetical protein